MTEGRRGGGDRREGRWGRWCEKGDGVTEGRWGRWCDRKEEGRWCDRREEGR